MGLGWVTGGVGLQVPLPVKQKAPCVGAGRSGAGRQRRLLGAVVPVVVDVDRSCDATDNEWDPSRDQIEPGNEWGLGVREMENQGGWGQMLRNLDSGSLSQPLPLKILSIFCRLSRFPGNLAMTDCSKGQRPELLSHLKQYRSQGATRVPRISTQCPLESLLSLASSSLKSPKDAPTPWPWATWRHLGLRLFCLGRVLSQHLVPALPPPWENRWWGPPPALGALHPCKADSWRQVPEHGAGRGWGRVPFLGRGLSPGELLVEDAGLHTHPEQCGQRRVVQSDAHLRVQATEAGGPGGYCWSHARAPVHSATPPPLPQSHPQLYPGPPAVTLAPSTPRFSPTRETFRNPAIAVCPGPDLSFIADPHSPL